MSPLDAFWHLVNFSAPSVGIGMMGALWTKLFWRQSTRGVSWWRLSRWAIACSALMSVTGLVVLGHDGKMLTYGAMTLGCALTLWWVGFVRRGR